MLVYSPVPTHLFVPFITGSSKSFTQSMFLYFFLSLQRSSSLNKVARDAGSINVSAAFEGQY
uniref:Wsv042 n=1 Tax=White spot syndrome virus TaxID=92652 RepID=A0A2U9GH24_WSSV|nr:wsv042 [Shrimp white spot syndrome virus]